ncbi:MAG: DNA repair protein RadC [Eubacteriales bacterium]|nr:DNA repair protein RadC [Eubacteriales bacterium]
MAELSRYGHRQRMRDLYLSGGMQNAPDHNLLELYLSLVIPQKDVKPLAYDLINTFGSLENVINARPEELMKVNGVGECCAVAISLIKTINNRVIRNRNENTTVINSSKVAMEYCCNLLSNENVEKCALITLTNKGAIINCHVLDNGGSVSEIKISLRTLINYIVLDNAAGFILAHNHPNGNSEPSLSDIDFTQNIKFSAEKLGVNMIDHIIVGSDDCFSFSKDSDLIRMK